MTKTATDRALQRRPMPSFSSLRPTEDGAR
jgi:hypothetical protein